MLETSQAMIFLLNVILYCDAASSDLLAQCAAHLQPAKGADICGNQKSVKRR